MLITDFYKCKDKSRKLMLQLSLEKSFGELDNIQFLIQYFYTKFN
jgi:hypothetical protein